MATGVPFGSKGQVWMGGLAVGAPLTKSDTDIVLGPEGITNGASAPDSSGFALNQHLYPYVTDDPFGTGLKQITVTKDLGKDFWPDARYSLVADSVPDSFIDATGTFGSLSPGDPQYFASVTEAPLCLRAPIVSDNAKRSWQAFWGLDLPTGSKITGVRFSYFRQEPFAIDSSSDNPNKGKPTRTITVQVRRTSVVKPRAKSDVICDARISKVTLEPGERQSLAYSIPGNYFSGAALVLRSLYHYSVAALLTNTDERGDGNSGIGLYNVVVSYVPPP